MLEEIDEATLMEKIAKAAIILSLKQLQALRK